MLKKQRGTLGIDLKNPATFGFGNRNVKQTLPRPRRWDGSFNKINGNECGCAYDGSLGDIGIGKVRAQNHPFTLACVLDISSTRIRKNLDHFWVLEVWGVDSTNSPFLVWRGKGRYKKQLIGDYERDAGTDASPAIKIVKM